MRIGLIILILFGAQQALSCSCTSSQNFYQVAGSAPFVAALKTIENVKDNFLKVRVEKNLKGLKKGQIITFDQSPSGLSCDPRIDSYVGEDWVGAIYSWNNNGKTTYSISPCSQTKFAYNPEKNEVDVSFDLTNSITKISIQDFSSLMKQTKIPSILSINCTETVQDAAELLPKKWTYQLSPHGGPASYDVSKPLSYPIYIYTDHSENFSIANKNYKFNSQLNASMSSPGTLDLWVELSNDFLSNLSSSVLISFSLDVFSPTSYDGNIYSIFQSTPAKDSQGNTYSDTYEAHSLSCQLDLGFPLVDH